MTTQEFFELFKKSVEADIGDGELSRADIAHLSALFEDTKDIALCGLDPKEPT